MTIPTPNASGPDRSGTARPRWHLAYYFLAAFDVLTICTTLFLTHCIVENYRGALATNQLWTAELDRSAELARLAGAVNAPGNDVFETLDVGAETARMEIALRTFTQSLQTTRGQLHPPSGNHAARTELARLLRDLDQVQVAMSEMTSEARRIFSHFANHRADLAGTRMATMDRRYAAVNTAVAMFNTDVREIQDRLLDEQQAAATQLQRFEWLIALCILLIVAAVTVYGHRIAREMTRAADERDQHLGATARFAEELAAARDAALAASRAKSAFLATMSHELRTPLNGMLGMTTLLLESKLDSEQRGLATTARDSGVSLLGLLEDVLEYSKAEGGRMRGESVDFDPQRLTEDVLAELAEGAAGKRLGLSLYVSPQLPRTVGGDATRLRQVLTHLVGNAIKFTDQGEVQVRIMDIEDCGSMLTVRFEVRDTGPGIPQAAQPQLFEPFTQADSSTTRRHGGAGMGLAVCHRLVRLMGGRIELESQVGHGSTLQFTLPLEARAAVPAREPSAATHRVLCVVDRNWARESLRQQLLAWGYDVDTAASPSAGRTCLEAAVQEHRPFDLVVIKLSAAPDGTLAALRSVQSPRPAAFVWVNSGNTSLRASAGGAAAETVLPYPLRPSSLRETLAVLSRSFVGEAATSEPTPAAVLRVLVAEEHPMNQRLLQLQLQKLGHHVLIVPDGRSAIQALAREAFDVVLLDTSLHDPDGVTTARELRLLDTPNAHSVPIIALALQAEHEDLARFRDAGMNDQLSKPVRMEPLSAMLSRWTPKRGTNDLAA